MYHGTGTAERVTAMEWLSFEIECAENFARARGPPGGGGPGGRPGRGGPGGGPGHGPPPAISYKRDEQSDSPETEYYGADEFAADSKGYLHEYRTTRDLTRILYIDGLAAGKSSIGTLDTQDFVLRNLSSKPDKDNRAGGDYQRAADLCSWGAEIGIEGFIRLEPGFEVILCDFTNGLAVSAINQRPAYGQPEATNTLQRLEHFRGVAARYQGITAGRAVVDYSSMVSAYFYPLNLTNPDPEKKAHARLAFAPVEAREKIKADVEQMLLKTQDPIKTIDWQGIVDMIVSRYSDRMQFMAEEMTTFEALRSEINFLLTHFIDYSPSTPDVGKAIAKCTEHYISSAIPVTKADHLIHAGIHTTSHKICSTLFAVRDQVLAADSEDKEVVEIVKTEIKELMNWLGWSTWLECGKCAIDEVCVVAIWPSGTLEDHLHPACRKQEDMGNRGGYWGGFGGRGQ